MAPGGIISLVSFQPWVWQSRAASPWHFLYKMGSNLGNNKGSNYEVSISAQTYCATWFLISHLLVFHWTFLLCFAFSTVKQLFFFQQRSVKIKLQFFFISWRRRISRTYFQSLAIKYCSSSSLCSQSSTIFSVYRCSIRHDRILQDQQHKYLKFPLFILTTLQIFATYRIQNNFSFHDHILWGTKIKWGEVHLHTIRNVDRSFFELY